MVGGAAMYLQKIIENAVNSKDHTTLVAGKSSWLVETLGKGPLFCTYCRFTNYQ
jgi:hypothetical protein